MRRRLAVSVGCAFAALALAAPSSADHLASPCNEGADPGHSEFAKHHIASFAHAGRLGAGGHKPGEHFGFATCNPNSAKFEKMQP